MEYVQLPLRHVLVEADEQTAFVYFMERGLASIVASSKEHDAIEVGHVGREGVSGSHLILQATSTPNRTFMQVAGVGIQIPADAFQGLLADDFQTLSLFLRYVQTTQIQLSWSALANGRFTMPARLARWLLMCHDRVDSDHLPLTHEFLATMLGVRRSGVTEHIHLLEGRHAIKNVRGDIYVLNRGLLEEIAGASYGVPEAEYKRLIPTADPSLA
jgi:CRP-like cAMP-binding protein